MCVRGSLLVMAADSSLNLSDPGCTFALYIIMTADTKAFCGVVSMRAPSVHARMFMHQRACGWLSVGGWFLTPL